MTPKQSIMVSQRGRDDIVARLNELVEAASTAKRQQSGGISHHSQSRSPREAPTTEDALQVLYPSLGSG